LLNEVGLYVVLLEVLLFMPNSRTIRSLVQGRIHKLKNCVNSRPKSVFNDQEAVKCHSSLHDKYVIVPADKASNNIVFVCKSYSLSGE
jgi:N-glycosylase/DNA lyase